MGLIQSVIAVIKTSNPAPTPVTDTSSDTVETKLSSDSVKEPTAEPTIVKETVEEVKPDEVKPVEVKSDEVKPDEVKPVENVPQTPIVPVADNISANERYITPVGTKVEVAPVNVTPNADVVKKNKKHKKNKN